MSFYSSIFWTALFVGNKEFLQLYFFFFFAMDKAKKKTLIGEIASVKKKRFILYRQQSILCNVADIKHFGGKVEICFP